MTEHTEVVVPAVLPVIEEPVSISEIVEAGREIGTSWRSTTAQLLLTASRCDRAFSRYGSRHLSALLRAAQISKPTFMKLVVIGRDVRLSRIQALLPPSYSIIHQISQLTDETFNEAVRAGIIHPHVRRAEIEALRKPSSRESKQASDLSAAVTEITAGGHYEFAIPKDVGVDRCAKIKKALGALRKKFGIDIVAIMDLDVSKTIASPADHS